MDMTLDLACSLDLTLLSPGLNLDFGFDLVFGFNLDIILKLTWILDFGFDLHMTGPDLGKTLDLTWM